MPHLELGITTIGKDKQDLKEMVSKSRCNIKLTIIEKTQLWESSKYHFVMYSTKMMYLSDKVQKRDE